MESLYLHRKINVSCCSHNKIIQNSHTKHPGFCICCVDSLEKADCDAIMDETSIDRGVRNNKYVPFPQ